MNCTSSSRVFSAALATLIAAIFTTDLHAGASNKNGNPFGNGSFFSNTGTFSAVVRGSNLSGTVYFSTGTDSNSASTTSSSGSSEIVYEGYTYTGNSQAAWNPSSSAISGQLNGGQLLSGTNSSSVISPLPPTIIEKVTNTIVTNTSVDPFTGATNSTASNITTTNMIVIGSVGKNTFNDSLYMSGNFLGNVNNSYPNQTFSAYGTDRSPNRRRASHLGFRNNSDCCFRYKDIRFNHIIRNRIKLGSLQHNDLSTDKLLVVGLIGRIESCFNQIWFSLKKV